MSAGPIRPSAPATAGRPVHTHPGAAPTPPLAAPAALRGRPLTPPSGPSATLDDPVSRTGPIRVWDPSIERLSPSRATADGFRMTYPDVSGSTLSRTGWPLIVASIR